MGLFDGVNNMSGPIQVEVRDRIVRYLHQPSAAGWDDICSIIINDAAKGGPRTVWQAVRKVDPTFPSTTRPGALDRTRAPNCSARMRRPMNAATRTRR